MIIQGQSQKPDPIDVVETVKSKDPSYRISNQPNSSQVVQALNLIGYTIP